MRWGLGGKEDGVPSLFFCERAMKRCVNVGKNSKKYTGKLLEKLEFSEHSLN